MTNNGTPAAEVERAVLGHIRVHGPCSTKSIRETLPYDKSAFERALRALHASGLVVSEGATSNRRHRLATAADTAPPSSDTPTAQPAETAAETPAEAPPASGPPLPAGTIPPFAGDSDDTPHWWPPLEVRSGSDDREVDLICTIVHELESLDPDACNRVLDYVENRYEGR